jgi:hypothetical protein
VAASTGNDGLLLNRAAGIAHQSGRSGLFLFGMIGLSGASLCGSSLWWLRRRRA